MTGRFEFVETDEDVHTAVERRLGELVGARRWEAPHGTFPQRSGSARPPAVPAASSARADLPAASPRRRARRCRQRQPATPSSPPTPTSNRRKRFRWRHHLLAYAWMVAARRRAVRRCGGRVSPCRRSVPAHPGAARSRSSRTRRRPPRHGRGVHQLDRRSRVTRLRRRIHLLLCAGHGAPLAALRGTRAVGHDRVRVGDVRRRTHDRVRLRFRRRRTRISPSSQGARRQL